MDKNNKNRTDLLAAGRKRLQQFRQKKDGKGSKSSGKAGKSERNVDADAASSVAIPAEKEPEVQVPDGERSVQDMSPGLLDSSDMHPREKSVVTDIVAETLDHAISVLPEAETAETTLSTVGFPTQDPIVCEAGANSTQGNESDVDASYEERTIRVLDNDMASVPSSETSEISIREGKSIHVGMPVPVDSLAPLDSVNASESGELVSTHREDISPGLLDSSDMHSRENSLVTDIDDETLDHAISVLPQAETAEATLSTVGFSTQDPIVGEAGACSTGGNECDVNASYEERTTRVLDSDMARASSSETSEKLMSGGRFVHVGMPTPVDSLAPLDFVNASEPGEMPSTRGEDQVPDVGSMQEAAYSGMEKVDRKSLIVLEGDMNPGVSRFDERTGVQAGIAQADQRTVSTSYEAEQMSQPDGFSAVNTTDGVEVQKIEMHSDSPQLLHILDGISVVSSEHMVQPRDHVMAGSVGVEVVILPSSSGYSENTENQGSSSSKILKNTGTCEGDVGPYSLSQLSKVVQRLDEDEFRFLLMERQSATSVHFVNTDWSGLHGYGSSDVLERLKEHLYLTYLEKHMFHLQLSEHLEIQRELDCRCVSLVDEISTASLSLNEVRGQNEFLADELARYRSGLELVAREKEELQRQIHSSKMELDEFSTRTDELQSELERSKLELSNVLEELVDCKDLVAALQVKNESLNGSLSSLTEEREKLAWEKADITLENEKLSRELVECKASLESSHVENVNSSEILALMTEERNKTEVGRQSFIRENSKLLADLASWKDLAESLQVENASLNEVLTSLSEDKSKLEEAKEYSVNETRKLSAELIGCTDLVDTLRAEHSNLNDRLALVMAERSRLGEENDYLKAEKDKEVVELLNCEVLLTCIQVEYKKVVEDLKEATVRLEHLNEANASLTSSLDMYKAKTRDVHDGQAVSFPSEEGGNKIEPFKLSSTEQEDFVVNVNSQHGFHKGDGAVFSTLIEKSFPNVLNLSSSSNQLQWDSSDDLSEFKALKGCLDQVEQVMQRLEEAVERMYSHSASLSRSGGNVVSSGVSKLIQAFESKAHTDDEELEEGPSVEIQPHSDPYMLTKELTIYMRKVINNLTLEAENASKLVKGERNQKMLSDTALRELNICHEALQEWNIIVEEANIELMVLYEVVKQHLHTIEAKKGKLLVLYEGSKQQEVILKAENSELERKLNDCESRISKLQVQCEELYRRSDDTVSSINLQLGVLQNEVAERALLLEKELNSTVSGVVKAVGMLDESIGTTHSSLAGDKVDGLDIGSHVAASVEVATTLIKNLQEKLKTVNGDHESLFSSFNELAEKYNDLHEKNALSTDALHKIYGNLEKLIDDSCSSIEESRTEIQNDKWLGLPVISNYDSLMGRLSELLSERLQFRSVNSKLNSELLGRAKDIEELNKRCIGTAHIRKMVGDIEGVVTLEGIEMNLDEPASFLMSLIHFLIEKYKEADEKVSVSKEMLGVKEIKLIELQGQVDDLSFVTLTYKNESLIYMESLRSAMEDLVVVQSEKQLKVTELEQSEQRVSSLREKLSIAVTKGKGLIVQRDGLKQSLASTSSELEKCVHELQLKDARLHEAETKLRTYSEAGARVEALESELSYIRNSATALRESFILKDSVIQRIEEILEDLELPEHFHARDIIEKVDWLARSVTGNSLPYNDWDQKSSAGGGSYADSGFGVTDAWKEDLQPNSFPGDDLRKKYDELQSKFYGLAEQNEMLEQSLMERNNLVQRWEEILDKINMPSQLRSLEPEDRIEWLGGALSEAYAHCDSLQKKIGDMESICESLTTDFEDSQRRLTDLDAALRSVTSEKEHLSAKVEILTQDYDRVSEKATISETENEKLQTNVLDLQSDKLRNEEYVDLVHGDIKRLQDLVREVLQDPNTEEQDLTSNSIDCLERLLWKLIEKYKNMSLGHAILGDAFEEQVSAETTNHVEMKSRHLNDQDEQNILVLKKELEKALDDLVHVKEERNRHVENSQSLVREVEALEIKGRELQELLIQEEHKSASVKEKLNVAVRKGKSLVQQRDSLRQTIDNVTTEVEHLKSVIELRESAISEYHQKIKAFESESLFMQNRFAETDSELQEKRQTLSRMLSVLAEIDVGSVSSTSDPVEKLKHIGKVWRDLHAAMASSEQDSRKSKRAAELLLAELNEVQERNDGLQEEVSKVTMELSELSKQRDLEEAAKCESLSRLERLSAIQLQERNKEVSALQVLKSGVDQLRVGFLEIHNIVTDVLPNELELLCNLEASVNSSLISSDALNVVGEALGDAPSGLVSCSSDDKVNLLHGESFLGSTTGEQVTDDTITELWSFVGFHLQDFASKIAALKEKLQSHSYSLHKEAICLSETWGTLHAEMTAQKHSFESIKADIARLEITEKETGVENLALRKNISTLYDACESLIMEIEKCKGQLVENATSVGDPRCNMGSCLATDGGDLFSGQTLSFSEECIGTMVNRLLSVVKDFHSLQGEIVEASQMEMKTTISNLQKELREKDIQKDRICVELVRQIKEAEAAAKNYLQELQLAKDQIHDLQGHVNVMDQQCNMFQQRIKDLEDQEATSVDMQGRVRSLTDALAAKEQEIEGLIQALDEEETQMEDLRNKVAELESLLQQKDLELENAEVSRGKAVKKLSVTVSKFDELHHLSATLLSEVEKLQSQLEERDAEISFLREEVTRCTNDALLASKMNKNNFDELWDLLSWLDSAISGMGEHDVHLIDKKSNQVHEYKDILQKKITSSLSELKDLKEVVQSRDNLLQLERSRVQELQGKWEFLEKSLREKESQLNLLHDLDDSGHGMATTSEITEAEPIINKWSVQGTSVAPQVRSLRKINNDQVAIAIDMDQDNEKRLEDEDDDKAHGFKSLTTSKIVPRFTRPVSDMVDGLWVSCDRALMRQPALRLGVIIYWAVLHALLATFVV